MLNIRYQRRIYQNLQRYLRQLELAESLPLPPPIDGIFDSDTERALREYQIRRGLPPTGFADQQTWELLYNDYRASIAQNTEPRPLLLFPLDPLGFAYESGVKDGFAVAAIQYMLRELERNYDDWIDLAVTGSYDQKTVNAVKSFQEKNRLDTTGKTDLLTWNTIVDQYNTLMRRYGQE